MTDHQDTGRAPETLSTALPDLLTGVHTLGTPAGRLGHMTGLPVA
ncbi:hypothetical protein [Streptomyces pseudogriseolus]|nr:hypothetical protein [Streptomyces gancidicus]